jgi:hypothetical protein
MKNELSIFFHWKTHGWPYLIDHEVYKFHFHHFLLQGGLSDGIPGAGQAPALLFSSSIL